MYQVFFNGFPLYDPRDEELVLRAPKTHLAVGEAGEMSFTIDPGHPYASRLTRLKGILELRSGGDPIFKGRIRKDTRGLYLSRDIEVEGLMTCLNDSIIPPFNFPEDFLNDAGYLAAEKGGNVIAFLLGWFLDQHNSQVGPEQQILLGDVTVKDPNNYLRRSSSDYITSMEAVKSKLADGRLGGHLLADYSGPVTRLHYYADLPLTNVQEVEFGKNLRDLVEELDGADTYTAILPIGAEGLTLASLPDGEIQPGIWKEGPLVYSKEAEDAIGGRITRKVNWDDVTVDRNLQTKAVAKLVGEGVKTVQTITVKAADLGAVEDLPRFVVGQHVRLKSAPHGFADTYPLMELDPDILDPANTDITMGSTILASTDISHANQKATQEILDRHQLELNRQHSDLQAMTQTLQEQITTAVQTSESIIFSALERYVETSNYEEYQREVSSQLSILAEQITLKFTQTVEQITDVNGDLQKTIETLEKHFDFTADGLTIRGGEQAMSLKLDNDIVSFWKNGQQFGWWDGVDFHTGNIIIEVNERAQFGNFAAIPRSNGSLSWLKVRG